MKPECPIDWKTAFTAALLGFLGAYLIGGYLNMPDVGAIVAIAYVGGRILWYLKRLEARQAEGHRCGCSRRYRSCRYDAGGQWHRRITNIPGRRRGEGAYPGGHRQRPMPAIAHRTKNHRLNVRFRR